MLEVLHDHPGGVVVDFLLAKACPGISRRLALDALRRLVDSGAVTLEGKAHRTDIAGALVRMAVSPAAMRPRIVAHPCPVSR